MKTRLITSALLFAILASPTFAGHNKFLRVEDNYYRFALRSGSSESVSLPLSLLAPDAITGNQKDFFQNTAMTSDTNYSPNGAPTNMDDVRITRTSTTLTITVGSVIMESLSVTNGNTFTIGNNGSSGNRTLTLGNSAGFTNFFSGVANDLIYLTGNSALTIHGPNLGANPQTLGVVLAVSGNVSVATGSSLTISAAISEAGGARSVTKTGGGTATFSGGAANTYTGNSIVNEGELDLNKTAGVNAIAGNIAVGDGAGAAGSAILKLLNNNQIANGSNIAISTDGTFNLQSSSETINNLNMSGGSVTGTGGTLNTAGVNVSGAGNQIGTGATVNGNTTINSAAILTVNGTLGGAATVNGALEGTGSVTGLVTNNGTVAPGNSPGTLTVGSFMQSSSGTLLIDMIGGNAGEFSVLNVSGAVSLDGSLTVNLDGFTPRDGQMFNVLLWGDTRTGMFSTVDITGTAFNGTFTINYVDLTGASSGGYAQLTAHVNGLGVPETGSTVLFFGFSLLWVAVCRPRMKSRKVQG